MNNYPVFRSASTVTDRPAHSVILHVRGDLRQALVCVRENQGKVRYELPLINALAVDLKAEAIAKVAQHHQIWMISEDVLVSKCVTLQESMPACNSRAEDNRTFNNARGARELAIPGKGGVGVAVIDTGVSLHEDLIHPYNRVVAFHDLVGGKSSPYDDDGHGTHVTGIIAGSGFVEQQRCGVAPYCHIIAIKALDHAGNGNASDILAGLQWILANRDRYHIKVVNLSLGITPDSSIEEDPLVQGVNAVVRSGLTVIAAAGNQGPGECTISSPGISPYVITVGAADVTKKPVTVAPFSSRGPTVEGLVKPDFLAPGVEISSLSNQDSRGYVVQSGTSMATPVVSGAAANLYAIWPNLTPLQIKKLLLRSCCRIEAESSFAQGYGLLY